MCPDETRTTTSPRCVKPLSQEPLIYNCRMSGRFSKQKGKIIYPVKAISQPQPILHLSQPNLGEERNSWSSHPPPNSHARNVLILQRDRDTAAQISPTETNLSGDREQPTEILSETGRDRALIVSPSLIGDSCPEITALLTLGEWHTKDSEEAEEKVVSNA